MYVEYSIDFGGELREAVNIMEEYAAGDKCLSIQVRKSEYCTTLETRILEPENYLDTVFKLPPNKTLNYCNSYRVTTKFHVSKYSIAEFLTKLGSEVEKRWDGEIPTIKLEHKESPLVDNMDTIEVTVVTRNTLREIHELIFKDIPKDEPEDDS